MGLKHSYRVQLVLAFLSIFVSSTKSFLITQHLQRQQQHQRFYKSCFPTRSLLRHVHHSRIKERKKAKDIKVENTKSNDEIYKFIEDRYCKGISDNDNKSLDNRRLRQYLYQQKHRKNPVRLSDAMDVIFYLEEICPSNKNDIGDSVDSKKMFVLSLLQENPRILRQNLENKLKPTVQFLMDLYGDELFQQAIKKNPSLLLLSGVGFNNNNNSKQKTNNNDSDENLYNNQHNKHYDSIDDFLQKELNLSLNKIQKLKKTSPKIFQLSLRKNIIPVIQFLADLIDDHTDYNNNNDYDENDEYSVHKEKFTRKLIPRTQNMITRAISSYPALLQLSVEMNLQPTVEFLQKECFMEYCEYDEHGDAKTQNDRKSNSNNNNNKALLNIIKTCPSTLGLSVKDSHEERITYWRFTEK